MAATGRPAVKLPLDMSESSDSSSDSTSTSDDSLGDEEYIPSDERENNQNHQVTTFFSSCGMSRCFSKPLFSSQLWLIMLLHIF